MTTRAWPRLKLLALSATLVTSGASALSAQVAIPLTPYAERLRTVKAVAGRDTFDMILDSGGGVNVVSPDVATRIGCVADGRAVGFRMRGDKAETPTCADAHLQVGGIDIRGELSILDLMGLIGPGQPRVDGLISLKAFAGRAITFDYHTNLLTVETPRSLRRRTATMTPVQIRLANGYSGSDLDLLVGVPTPSRTLWLLWDSGHLGPLFLPPHALRQLGIADTVARGTIGLPMGSGLHPQAKYVPAGGIIYDGVIGDEVIRRATWTLDLANGRMWVGPVDPLAP